MNMPELLFCLAVTFTQGMQAKHMFPNKKDFFSRGSYLSPGSRKVLAFIVYGDP